MHPFPGRRLREVTRQNSGHDVVAVVVNRERESEFVSPELAGIDSVLRRHDVIERSEIEASARPQEDTEILRVSVRGPQQPERDLCVPLRMSQEG